MGARYGRGLAIGLLFFGLACLCAAMTILAAQAAPQRQAPSDSLRAEPVPIVPDTLTLDDSTKVRKLCVLAVWDALQPRNPPYLFRINLVRPVPPGTEPPVDTRTLVACFWVQVAPRPDSLPQQSDRPSPSKGARS